VGLISCSGVMNTSVAYVPEVAAEQEHPFGFSFQSKQIDWSWYWCGGREGDAV